MRHKPGRSGFHPYHNGCVFFEANCPTIRDIFSEFYSEGGRGIGIW